MNYYRWIDRAFGKCRVPESFFFRKVLKDCAMYWDLTYPPKVKRTSLK